MARPAATTKTRTPAPPDDTPNGVVLPVLHDQALQQAIAGAEDALNYLQGVPHSWPPIMPMAQRPSVGNGRALTDLVSAALDRLDTTPGGHGGWTVGLVAGPTRTPSQPQAGTADVASSAVTDRSPAEVAALITGAGVHPLVSDDTGRRAILAMQAAGAVSPADAEVLAASIGEADDIEEALARAANTVTGTFSSWLVRLVQALIAAQDQRGDAGGLHPMAVRSSATDIELWLGCLGGGALGVGGGPVGIGLGCIAGAAGVWGAGTIGH